MRVKTEHRRRAILETATEVFRAKGFAATSMAEISQRLGGSKGTLYSYFTSKEELFSAVMLEMARQFADPIFDELERSGNTRAAIRKFTRRLVAMLASPKIVDFRRLTAAEGARSGIGKLCHEVTRTVYMSKFITYFRDQVASGTFRDADPVRAATHIDGLCSAGPAQLLLEGVVESIPEEELIAAADAAGDTFLRAYATAPARAKRPRPSRRRDPIRARAAT